MRKFLTLLVTLQITLMIVPAAVSAAEPVASLSGPAVVRAGDTISLAFKINGTGLSAVQGSVEYDPAQLTYKSSAGILTEWAVDIDGSSSGKVDFLGIDNDLTSPISSNKQLFTLSFQVRTNITVGARIRVTAADLSASDGDTDFYPTDAVYSVTVSPPLSANAFLSSMTVSNAEISPAFSKNTTAYSTTVPFTVSRLEVRASAEDSKAKVTISGQDIAVGVNTVSIVVTAENGSKKTYTVTVTREQDPDYQASANADLKSLTPGIGILSPVFDPAKTLYHIWLPFEIISFDAAGETSDPKASGVEKTGIELSVGENEFIITGIAEDGTRKDYRIIVTRMPEQGGEISDPTLTPTPIIESSYSEADWSDRSGMISSQTENESKAAGMPWWGALLIAVAAAILGFTASRLTGRHKSNDDDSDSNGNNDSDIVYM